MTVKTVNSDIRALGSAGVTRLQSQVLRQIVPQGIQIAFSFLELGLLLGTAGLGNEIYGELVGGCATDEIREVCELQVGRRLRYRGFLKSLRLPLELNEESPTLLGGNLGLRDDLGGVTRSEF